MRAAAWRSGAPRVDELRAARHRREVSWPARNVGSRRPVPRSHDAQRPRRARGPGRLHRTHVPQRRRQVSASAGPQAQGECVLCARRRPAAAGRAGAAPVTRESRKPRAVTSRALDCRQKRGRTTRPSIAPVSSPSPRDRVSTARQRGACRSSTRGAPRRQRSGGGRSRDRDQDGQVVVRTYPSAPAQGIDGCSAGAAPGPRRFAMPRRAPRVRALPTATRGGTVRLRVVGGAAN